MCAQKVIFRNIQYIRLVCGYMDLKIIFGKSNPSLFFIHPALVHDVENLTHPPQASCCMDQGAFGRSRASMRRFAVLVPKTVLET